MLNRWSLSLSPGLTSGLSRHDLVYNREETTATLLAKMAHLRPARELREDWTYVNLVRHLLRPSTAHINCILQFYMLTSEIVARYSGQPFAEFVSARIFSPVSMPASTYSFSAGEEAGTAVHWFTRAGRRLPPWIT
jgi:CubicO group peptidase (beta-lactamase class C family)